MAPTAVTCGLPSSLIVDSHVVRQFSASVAGAGPEASFSTTVAHSTAGSPSASPKLLICICAPCVVLVTVGWRSLQVQTCHGPESHRTRARPTKRLTDGYTPLASEMGSSADAAA